MSAHAKGTFEVTGWDEKPFSQISGGPKLTHASVSRTFSGDIEGEGTLAYLMVYNADGSANYVGLERIVGKIGKKEGSLVLQHTGTDDGSTARDSYTVVAGSGTGDLAGISGEGSFEAGRKEPKIAFTLDYDLGK